MAAKNRTMAGNSRTGDDGVVTSLGKDGDHADFKRKECNE
jgi:hypothetical protein